MHEVLVRKNGANNHRHPTRLIVKLGNKILSVLPRFLPRVAVRRLISNYNKLKLDFPAPVKE